MADQPSETETTTTGTGACNLDSPSKPRNKLCKWMAQSTNGEHIRLTDHVQQC